MSTPWRPRSCLVPPWTCTRPTSAASARTALAREVASATEPDAGYTVTHCRSGDTATCRTGMVTRASSTTSSTAARARGRCTSARRSSNDRNLPCNACEGSLAAKARARTASMLWFTSPTSTNAPPSACSDNTRPEAAPSAATPRIRATTMLPRGSVSVGIAQDVCCGTQVRECRRRLKESVCRKTYNQPGNKRVKHSKNKGDNRMSRPHRITTTRKVDPRSVTPDNTRADCKCVPIRRWNTRRVDCCDREHCLGQL